MERGLEMALKNLTPAKFRCGFGSCVGIYLEEDGKHLRIVGKAAEAGELQSRVGPDETIIRIERAMLDDIGGPLSRFFIRIGL